MYANCILGKISFDIISAEYPVNDLMCLNHSFLPTLSQISFLDVDTFEGPFPRSIGFIVVFSMDSISIVKIFPSIS